MTRLSHVGQFDLTTLLPAPLRQTVQDVSNVARNPITGAVKSVGFWSAYTPPVSYTGAQLDEMYRDPTPNPYMQLLQPVVVLDTVIGKKVLAPYGIPSQEAWRDNAKKLATGGLIAMGVGTTVVLIIGAMLGRARSPRHG